MKRIYNLDKIRGLTIISMVLFHLMYNINFFKEISWYNGTLLNKVRQLSIALSFFIISGITSTLLSSKKNIIRGIKTSIVGLLISISTYIFARDQFIVWGVMNGLGLSMIIGGLFKNINIFSKKMIFVFLLIFALTYNIPINSLNNIDFFKYLYELNLFPLGFPSDKFVSADYFPITPWVFTYFSGMSLGKFLHEKNYYSKYGTENFLAKIGMYSMPIYLIHQVILYPIVSLFFR